MSGKPAVFNIFHFYFVNILKQSRDYLAMQKTSGVVSPKKKFLYCLCVFFSSNVIFSTSTACETHNFEYFSFLSRIHLKQTMNYLKMHQKSGIPRKKSFSIALCVFCSIKVIFSTLTACKTHNFQYF